MPTTALSTLFQNSYACSISLEISSTSLPAPASQVIPSLLFQSLAQTKVITDSGTGWLYCGLADTVVAAVPAAVIVAATATAATVAMTAAVTITAAVMTTVAAVAVAAAVAAAVMTAVSVVILRCMRSNPLMTAFSADGATGVAAASATTASLQRRRHQRYADLPASAHVWLCWDRAVAAGAKYSYSPFISLSLFSLSSISLFSLSSLSLSLLSLSSLSHLSLFLILEQNHCSILRITSA